MEQIQEHCKWTRSRTDGQTTNVSHSRQPHKSQGRMWRSDWGGTVGTDNDGLTKGVWSQAVSDFDSLRWSFTDRQTRLRHSIPDSCSSICLSTCSTLSLFEFSWKLIVKWKLFEIESFENHLNQNEYASIFNIRSKTFESWFESFENYFLLIALCFQKIIVNVISVYQFMKK